MEITTIKITKKTKSRLDRIKVSKRESYEEVIQKMLSILNLCKANPSQARTKLEEIDSLRSTVEDKKET